VEGWRGPGERKGELNVTQKTEFRLIYASGVDLNTANALRGRIATILERPDFGELTIIFSSEGGSTDQSLALFNLIARLPVPVHMHAAGHVGSASIPPFLAGSRRTSSPFSRFFFHEYDWGFTERQTLKRMDEAVKRLRSDIDIARQIIQSRTNAGADLLDALDGSAAPAILTPDQAKALGFVNEVCELGKTRPDGMPVAMWAL
jgi:ATP-dependent protease ClpP protease subunit